VPGFVDIQVNGGGGVLFNSDPTVEGIRKIADAHLRFGTTAILPTLISDDIEVVRAGISAVRRAIETDVPGILGLHLEGPFLNPERKGAHDPEKFRVLTEETIKLFTSLGNQGVTLLTLAPERTTSARIRQLVQAGTIVFGGHTAASYEQCVSSEAAGLSGYTHLFNAMTPLTSREPGVVGAALDSKNSVFGIIADGHHVHPASFRLACSRKKRGGALLVTDAMPTVGSDIPEFELNGELIRLNDGVLRNSAGSLAGSNLTMIDAIRNAKEFAGLDWWEAIRMATVYPARAIGLEHRIGAIEPGRRADMVELDDEFRIARVWRRGEAL
jgi:N-acetylglucosamine-6-phosphate deacetylase